MVEANRCGMQARAASRGPLKSAIDMAWPFYIWLMNLFVK
jgi:hypothetical protein